MEQLCTRYAVETNDRGVSEDEIFQFRIDNFKGLVKNLTFYSLPFEFSDMELKHLVEAVLKSGKSQKVVQYLK